MAAQTNTKAQWAGLAVGGVGLVLAVLCLVADAEAFFQGYLAAFIFWLGLPLGSLALLMLHHLSAGGWGFVAQRHFEAAAQTVALLAVFFVPMLFGLHYLYEWTHAEAVAESEVLRHKEPYLNVPFFIIRAAVYFVFWTAAAFLLARWSGRLDDTGDAKYVARLRALAAAGLIGHVLLLTFASVDWVMSLEPEWFSSIFGWMLLVSEVLAALAVAVLVLGRLRAAEPIASVIRTKHFHDYGNLLLAFVILWTYMMFAQYLIIWSGNLPEEVRWFVHRREGGWLAVATVLVLFHFAVPFFVLLSRRAKRSARALSALAAFLLLMHVLFVAWLVIPSFREAGLLTYASAAAAFVGMGGFWLAAYLFFLARRPLLPKGDPRIQDALYTRDLAP